MVALTAKSCLFGGRDWKIPHEYRTVPPVVLLYCLAGVVYFGGWSMLKREKNKNKKQARVVTNFHLHDI